MSEVCGCGSTEELMDKALKHIYDMVEQEEYCPYAVMFVTTVMTSLSLNMLAKLRMDQHEGDKAIMSMAAAATVSEEAAIRAWLTKNKYMNTDLFPRAEALMAELAAALHSESEVPKGD
jgi:uncharacterized membrane protein (DUF106 family)